MPDPLSTAELFERAGAKVDDLFADRREGDRDPSAVTIRMRNGRLWVVGAIVGKLESTAEFTPQGDTEELETVTVDIRAADVSDLPGIPYRATVELAGDDRPFSVAASGSSRNEVWLRLALVRRRLVEEKPLRRR